MAWQKGQSGNPKGRPPKGRALTDLLAKALNKRIPVTTIDEDGTPTTKNRQGKLFVADQVVSALTTGFITFADGTSRPIDTDEWSRLLRWVYQHIDGAKQNIDLATMLNAPLPMQWLDPASEPDDE